LKATCNETKLPPVDISAPEIKRLITYCPPGPTREDKTFIKSKPTPPRLSTASSDYLFDCADEESPYHDEAIAMRDAWKPAHVVIAMTAEDMRLRSTWGVQMGGDRENSKRILTALNEFAEHKLDLKGFAGVTNINPDEELGADDILTLPQTEEGSHETDDGQMDGERRSFDVESREAQRQSLLLRISEKILKERGLPKQTWLKKTSDRLREFDAENEISSLSVLSSLEEDDEGIPVLLDNLRDQAWELKTRYGKNKRNYTAYLQRLIKSLKKGDTRKMGVWPGCDRELYAAEILNYAYYLAHNKCSPRLKNKAVTADDLANEFAGLTIIPYVESGKYTESGKLKGLMTERWIHFMQEKGREFDTFEANVLNTAIELVDPIYDDENGTSNSGTMSEDTAFLDQQDRGTSRDVEQSKQVREVFALLTAAERTIAKKILDGDTWKEIGAAEGVPADTARKRFDRAIDQALLPNNAVAR
jgi:hypothetical protein